jgi:hypothetical protein
MVLRWIPDVVTEEFYNVGVVVYEPTTHYLKGLFHYNKVDDEHYKHMLMAISDSFNDLARRLPRDRHPEKLNVRLENICYAILAKDDSSLQWHYPQRLYPAYKSLDEESFKLFTRMVNATAKKWEDGQGHDMDGCSVL